MRHVDYRNKLIENTISLVASVGLDKTTTKLIVKDTGINEAYIYRFFTNKEDLLSQTFTFLDEEIRSKILQHLHVIYMQEMDRETRCWLFFSGIWKFLVNNGEKCVVYMRYYYSAYYKRYSEQAHVKRYTLIAKKLAGFFENESEVRMLIGCIFSIMMDFAIRIYNLEIPNNKNTTDYMFRLVYNSITPYFKCKENNIDK